MSTPLHPNFIERLIEIAQAAGKEIMVVYQGDITTWTKKDDSPLTEADLRADRLIRAALADAYPDIPVLSEEFDSGLDQSIQRFFLVDPLDGTKEFLKRSNEFTVNIALIDAGRPIAGIVAAPALNTLYFASNDLGAWRRDNQGDTRLQVTNYQEGQTLRIIGSQSHATAEMDEWLKKLSVPYNFYAAGSSLKFCRVAEGAADIYPRFGLTSQWDTAAGQCIVEAAGGSVITLDRTALRYGLDRPVLNPHFIACGAGFADHCFRP
ncbi:MAG: 3'(2'),5'-bisphosphate nucleotidase CysQ [Nitrosomonas sp.]|nr:MAG: 3'(2'),5'-bisphosphate nucleotidase CysQ [Nitrosomonas sp.]